jgi:hypothetical protein
VPLAVYSEDDQINGNYMGRICSMHGEKRYAYTILFGISEGNGSFWRPRSEGENIIKNDLK